MLVLCLICVEGSTCIKAEPFIKSRTFVKIISKHSKIKDTCTILLNQCSIEVCSFYERPVILIKQ